LKKVTGGQKSLKKGILIENIPLYQRYLNERSEILRHKWLESEKEGHDIGFERALLEWVLKHRTEWRKKKR
jgi:hypothetical protein|tara:strand:- start:763 stop:975 length:213 start_codon:yes stop_codon:yes gene_type:complete